MPKELLTNRLDRIEQKIDSILDHQADIRERQAKLETVQKGFTTVLAAVVTSFIGYIFTLFNR